MFSPLERVVAAQTYISTHKGWERIPFRKRSGHSRNHFFGDGTAGRRNLHAVVGNRSGNRKRRRARHTEPRQRTASEHRALRHKARQSKACKGDAAKDGEWASGKA